MHATLLHLDPATSAGPPSIATDADDLPPDVLTTASVTNALNYLLDEAIDAIAIESRPPDISLECLLGTIDTLEDETTTICRHDLLETADLDAAAVDVALDEHDPIPPDALRDTTSTDETDGPSMPERPTFGYLPEATGSRGFALVDGAGTLTWIDPTLADAVDASPDDLVDTDVGDLDPDGRSWNLDELTAAALEAGDSVWSALDHSAREWLFCTCPVTDDEALVIGYPPNISQAVEADFLNRLNELFFIVDLDGDFVYWNDQVAQVTGLSDATLASTNALELFDPEDRADAVEALAEVGQAGSNEATLRLETAEGEAVPFRFSGALLDDPDGEEPLVCGVARDISDRVRMQRQIEAAMSRLASSNAELEQFAYVASHDLREPLRGIQSYLELLSRRYGDDLDAEAREFVDFATQSADRMRTMINELLDHSRVGSEMRLEEVDCNAVVEEVCEALRVHIDDADADVDVADLPTVHADRHLVNQLFQNLIDNAITHAEAPPTVTVTADAADGDMVHFAVADDAEGMNADQQEDVFKLFSAGGSSPGSGIGLATCRKIVASHDGDIWVDSAPGEGATFHFTLPASPRPDLVDPVTEVVDTEHVPFVD